MVGCKTSRMLLILPFFSICFAVVADFSPKGDVCCRAAMYAASKLLQRTTMWEQSSGLQIYVCFFYFRNDLPTTIRIYFGGEVCHGTFPYHDMPKE